LARLKQLLCASFIRSYVLLSKSFGMLGSYFMQSLKRIPIYLIVAIMALLTACGEKPLPTGEPTTSKIKVRILSHQLTPENPVVNTTPMKLKVVIENFGEQVSDTILVSWLVDLDGTQSDVRWEKQLKPQEKREIVLGDRVNLLYLKPGEIRYALVLEGATPEGNFVWIERQDHVVRVAAKN
jgi:hypothetical protein